MIFQHASSPDVLPLSPTSPPCPFACKAFFMQTHPLDYLGRRSSWHEAGSEEGREAGVSSKVELDAFAFMGHIQKEATTYFKCQETNCLWSKTRLRRRHRRVLTRGGEQCLKACQQSHELCIWNQPCQGESINFDTSHHVSSSSVS